MKKTRWLEAPMWAGAIGGFLVAIGLFLIIGGNGVGVGSEHSKDEILQQSNEIYSDLLVAPSTAAFASLNDDDTTVQALGNNYYFVSTYVDSQNENAAQIRDEYTMWMRYDESADEGERWEEVSLSDIQNQAGG